MLLRYIGYRAKPLRTEGAKKSLHAQRKFERSLNAMKKTLCNVRVFAENNRKKDGLLLYIEFSGQKAFLMVHRPDGILYSLLKDGCSVNELNRLVPQKYISRRVV